MKIFFTLVSCLALPVAAQAQIYPLSDNSWDNPEFVERFRGSYGFDLRTNPKISAEEKAIFDQVAQVAGQQPQQAINLIETSRNPESSAAVDFILGALYQQTGQDDRAIASYEAAVRKFPNFLRAYRNLGLAYVQRNEYEKALPMLVKTIESGGGDGTSFGLLGYTLLNLGRNDNALDAYRMALMFQPDSKDWRIGKLKALLTLDRYEEAVGILYEMIAEDGDNAELWLQQANAFLGMDQTDLAAANLNVARSLGFENPDTLVLLGNIYINRNLPELAAEPYLAALESGRVPVQRAVGVGERMALVASGETAQSIIDRIQSVYGDQLDTKQELTLFSLEANIALNAGEEDRAAELLEQVVSRDPTNGRALLTLAEYNVRNGEEEKAILNFQAAADDDTVAVRALIGHARLLISRREYRKGLQLLEQAYAKDPRRYLADYIQQVEQVARR
ncbi:MAG: tetratricopeptide repeat protein [Opitutales bacterium]